MRSAPTVALEALLDLPPLYVRIQSEAMLTGHRLRRSLGYLSGDMIGHLKICNVSPDVTDVLTVSDYLPLTFNFDHPFQVIFPDRCEWLDGIYPVPVGSIVYYSDGSKKNDSVGVGAVGPGLTLSLPLGSSPSVFQAEIIAIDLCARHCLSSNNTSNRDVFIFSDSQAALRALASYSLRSRLVFECLGNLKALATTCRLSLVWVPGHEGIPGNEEADELARLGAESDFIGPEPFCGLGDNHIKGRITMWSNQQKLVNFNSLPVSSFSRSTISYSSVRIKEILNLSKADISTLTGLLTGHCRLKHFLARINRANCSSCRLCNSANETAYHILCECCAVSRTRFRLLGKGSLVPSEAKLISPRSIIAYFKALRLEEV